MAEALGLAFAAEADERKIIVARWGVLQAGLGAQLIGQADCVGIIVEPKIAEHGEDIRVILEVFNLDRDSDDRVGINCSKAIPKIGKSKLPAAIGQ